MNYIQVKSAESHDDLTIFINNIEYLSADPNSQTSTIGLVSGKILIVDLEYVKLVRQIKLARIGME